MSKEDKELLLRDLSARLPYRVKVTTTNSAVKIGVVSGISIKNKISVETKHATIVFDCTEVRPYLRKMSSMTEEEAMEYANCGNIIANSPQNNYLIPNPNCVDWLNAHHFDYRGLLERGLAIKITKENNPYEN